MSLKTLSPSGAARRMACPGSHRLEGAYPQDSSTYAREGIAAHWLASELLRHGTDMRSKYQAGGYTPAGMEITEDMYEGAELYCGFIRDNEFADQIHIEERMHIATIHPDCWGTPDCWTVQMNTKSVHLFEIHIYDYKFGRGFVEVYENWQLIEYAAGIISKLGIDGLTDQRTIVHMHIIQPRSFHPEGQIRTWSATASDLRPYFNQLRSAEDAAMGESPATVVSPECNHCAARHACPALQIAAMKAVDIAASAVPHNLKPVELATELRFLEHAQELLEARISGLSAEALALIKRGERLPHYHAEQSKGRERWNRSADEIIALGELSGINLVKPAVITPKQALSKGMDDKLVRTFSETPYGELKLVALDTRKTDKIFGKD